jgi:hypothetical protein
MTNFLRYTLRLFQIVSILSFTSCATIIKTKDTKFYYPTYKQWKSLNNYEMKIVNDFTFNNNYIAPEYSHLKKIRFNKNGRKKLAEIRKHNQKNN